MIGYRFHKPEILFNASYIQEMFHSFRFSFQLLTIDAVAFGTSSKNTLVPGIFRNS